jgi:hypothetical protein
MNSSRRCHFFVNTVIVLLWYIREAAGALSYLGSKHSEHCADQQKHVKDRQDEAGNMRSDH